MAAAAEAEDLEALFDQIAAQRAPLPAPAPAPAAPAAALAAVAPPAALAVPAPAAAPAPAEASNDAQTPPDVYQRVGALTRTLHDALKELGYDRQLECAVEKLPDARDRLNYIARLTGEAAEKALAAVERGQAVQRKVGDDAARLAADWDRLYAGALGVEEFKRLAGETRGFLAALPRQAGETDAQLHEIMMAQDFHDLTGQVINRIVPLAQNLEAQLLQLLLEARPDGRRGKDEEWLTGPAMNAGARSDVVQGQAQVDELLASLGF
jgi:chemotaxis protein CheZ